MCMCVTQYHQRTYIDFYTLWYHRAVALYDNVIPKRCGHLLMHSTAGVAKPQLGCSGGLSPV